ncbi:hypothetical protein MRB53_042114 [Persea americana]|nr:hypothetical protein MRB53_042114 [Persea americana]
MTSLEASLISHRFGNLVTMDFWDGLWLNEGFATWMSWYSCNHFFPEWKVWESYVGDSLAAALSLDSLRSSHPIEVPIKRAEEVNQIFDAISYRKGSCIIRTITAYIGEETFMEGIRQYLKKHAYGNTETNDLWAALSDASGKDIAGMMDTWTRNVGYPVLTVKEDEREKTIHVKQNRFLKTADVKPEEDQTIFPVVLGLRNKHGIDMNLMLTEREQTFKVQDTDFFKLNANHTGIYRTFYSSERLEKLGQAAKKGLLSTEDRMGMVADASALSAAGYQKTSGTLALLKGFTTEDQYLVWSEVVGAVSSIRAAWQFQDDRVKEALKAFLGTLTFKKAESLGWTYADDEDHIMAQFKALMFSSAGVAGDKEVIAAAKSMFEKYKAGDKSAIHPNLRSSVYAIVLRTGGESEYNTILSFASDGKTADERNTALRALGCARSPALIKRTLSLPFTDVVRDQDTYLPLSSLRTHRQGIEALWEWLQSEWETIIKRLPPSGTMLATIVQMCTSGFSRTEDADKIKKFFEGKDHTGYDRSLMQSIDSVTAKSNWVTRDGSDVEGWLKSEGYLS